MKNGLLNELNHNEIKYVKTVNKKYEQYRFEWENNIKTFKVSEYPLNVDIETTTACNLKCIMCFQGKYKFNNSNMKTLLFKSIIDQIKDKVYAVKLQYRGEPLTDVRIIDFVKMAKNAGILEVMFNTNGMFLNKDIAKSLIMAGLDKLICSMDSVDKETYEAIRVGAKFETVVNNIETLQELKKELNKSNPIVRMQAVICEKNKDQTEKYIEFWEHKVEQLGFNDVLDFSDESEDDTAMPYFSCAQLWQRMFILTDGTVLPCCRAIEGIDKLLLTIGNVKHDSIYDLWHSDKMDLIRKIHQEGASHKLLMCRKCALRKYIKKHKNIEVDEC